MTAFEFRPGLDNLPTQQERGAGPISAADRRYPALQALAVLIKVVTIVAFGLFVIGTITVSRQQETVGTGILLIACAALAALFMWAGAELILVLVDIERNTRTRAATPQASGGGV